MFQQVFYDRKVNVMKKELYEEYFMALLELITLLTAGSIGLFTIVVVIAFTLKGQLEVIFLLVAVYMCYTACINSLYWLNARVGKIKWLKNCIYKNNQENI